MSNISPSEKSPSASNNLKVKQNKHTRQASQVTRMTSLDSIISSGYNSSHSCEETDEMDEVSTKWSSNEEVMVKEFYGLLDLTITNWSETESRPGVSEIGEEDKINEEKNIFKSPFYPQWKTLNNKANLNSASFSMTSSYGDIYFSDSVDPMGIKGSIYKYIKLKGNEEDDKLLDDILLTSENFKPKIFLEAIHSNTSFDDLMNAKEKLKQSIDEKSELLKNLVKENFDRFVNAKLTVDHIYADMKRNIYAKNDYGLTSLFKFIETVRKETEKLIGPLIRERKNDLPDPSHDITYKMKLGDNDLDITTDHELPDIDKIDINDTDKAQKSESNGKMNL